jgi:hypothetical protein
MMRIIGEEIEGQSFLLRDSAFKEGDKYVIKIVSMSVDLIKGVDIIQTPGEDNKFVCSKVKIRRGSRIDTFPCQGFLSQDDNVMSLRDEPKI